MEKDYFFVVNKFDEPDSKLGESTLRSKISEISKNSLNFSGGSTRYKSDVEDKKNKFFNDCENLIRGEILKSSYQNSLDDVKLIKITAIFKEWEEPYNQITLYKYGYSIKTLDENNPNSSIYLIEELIITDNKKTSKDPYSINTAGTYLYNIFKNGGNNSSPYRLGYINKITPNNENIYYLSGTSQNIQFTPKNGSILYNGVFVYKKGENTAKKINCINNNCSLNPQSLNLLPCDSALGYDFTSDIAVKININEFTNNGERYIKQGYPVIICSDDLGYLNGKHLSYNKDDDIKNIVDVVNEDTTINFINSSEDPYTVTIENGSIKILNGDVNRRNIQITLDDNIEDSLYKIMIGNSSLVFKGRTLNLSNGEFHRMFGISISDIKPGFSKKINNIKYGPTTSTESFSIVYKQPALYFNGNPDNTTPTVVSVPERDGYDVQQDKEETLSMIIKNIELIKIGNRLIKINYPKYEENS